MTTTNCPHCGAEEVKGKYSFISYLCGYEPGRVFEGCKIPARRFKDCYEREIAKLKSDLAAAKAKSEESLPVKVKVTKNTSQRYSWSIWFCSRCIVRGFDNTSCVDEESAMEAAKLFLKNAKEEA